MPKSKDQLFPPLGVALHYLRTIAKISREDFGRPLGLPSKTISDYESGHRTLGRKLAEQLLSAHGIEPQALDEVLADISARRSVIFPEGTFPLPPEELHRLAREGREISRAIVSEVARLRRRDRARADHALAGELFEQLAGSTPHQRWLFVTRAEKFRLWALSVRFGEESTKAASADTDRAAEYATLSLRIARLAPAAPKFRALLEGQAWAFLANGRRVKGYLPKADLGFARSARLWQEGEGGDPDRLLDPTRRLDLEASLRLDQGRLDEALELLDRALAEGPQGVVAGRRLVQKAFVLERYGQPEAALSALDDAEMRGAGLDPQLGAWIVGNRAVNFCHLGRFEEAAVIVPVVRTLAIELRNTIDLVRVDWLEARVLAGLGRIEEAILKLRSVKQEFSAQGDSVDTALASIDLAALHLDRGQPRFARELAADVAKLLDVQGVPRDLLAALILFVQALEQERATAAAARDLIRALERRRPIESTSLAEEK
ncbi:MAG: tetratricopeptide repeat protein [Acidobacteriota bacterium]